MAYKSISAYAGKCFSLMGLWKVGPSYGFHGAQGHPGRASKAPKMRLRVAKRRSFLFVFLRHFDLVIGGYPLKIAVGNQRIPRSEGSIVSMVFFDQQLDRSLFDTAWWFVAWLIVAPAMLLQELDQGYILLANNQLN